MRALKALRNTATGGAYAGNLRRFATLGTLRAMHRLGMIRADAGTIQHGVYVSLTEHGRACSEDAATLDGVTECNVCDLLEALAAERAKVLALTLELQRKDDDVLAKAVQYADEATRLEKELAAERAKVALLSAPPDPRDLMREDTMARDLEELRATLAKVEAERDAWKESASMACETPADDCDCAGCRYADEKMMPKGTKETP
jgi:hypothetical protein